VKLSDAFVAGTEVLGEHPCDIRDIETSGAKHLLNVRPVPPAIEEGLEHGEIIASQKREQAVGQPVFGDMEMEIVMEPSRVEEDVDG
jgi:hypothetical protein